MCFSIYHHGRASTNHPRLTTSINPTLSANEHENLYTGKGFGEAFEFRFDSSEAREHGLSMSADDDDPEAQRLDKLRKDLISMWPSGLYSDVRISLTGNFGSSHESTTAISLPIGLFSSADLLFSTPPLFPGHPNLRHANYQRLDFHHPHSHRPRCTSPSGSFIRAPSSSRAARAIYPRPLPSSAQLCTSPYQLCTTRSRRASSKRCAMGSSTCSFLLEIYERYGGVQVAVSADSVRDAHHGCSSFHQSRT